MFNKRYRLILVIIMLVLSVILINQFILPHDEAPQVTREIIVNNTAEELGSVEVIRNVGNPDGERIAYVVGVHPLENDTHQTFLKMMANKTDLNNCYDIYIINVSMDYSSYGQLLPDDEPGRAEGQNLALKYVYPQIVNGSYRLAVDVHAHGGAYGDYNTFVFSPVDGSSGEFYGRNVSESSQNISYYNPQHTTSGPYLTVPLNEKGIPAFYFEENSFISQDIKDSHMLELIDGVDNLKFK